MVDQIGIRFVAEGAAEAIQAIQNYRNVQTETVAAIKAGQAATAGFTRDLRTLLTTYQGAERASGAYKEALREIKRQLAALTGSSIQAASAGIDKLAQSMDAATNALADDTARAAFERIRASVDPATAAVERFQSAMQQVDAALQRGVVSQREFEAVSARLRSQRDAVLAKPVAAASDTAFALSLQREKALAEAQENTARAAQAWAAQTNAALGVTGQRATELGATYSRLEQVQTNLAAGAQAWATQTNAALGVTGQRATELGATFTRLAQVQDNLAAGSRAWASALNARLGVTGPSAAESGATSSALFESVERAQAAYTRLRASIDPTIAAAQKMAAAQRAVDEAVRLGIITAEQGAATMSDYRRGLEDTSKANEILRRETQQLAMSYNPALAAQMAFEDRQQDLNRAVQLGVLTTDAYEAQIQQMTLALAEAGNSVVGVQRFMNQYGESVRVGGVATNRFGMYAQQVGYQVGDFFVQVQSGTNVFVAFGQQATQLAGLLPGVAGAIIGISISVGTMLLASWDRWRKANDETASSLKRLDDEVKALDTSVAQWLRTREAAAKGITVDELVGGESLKQAQENLAKAQAAFDQLTKKVTSPGYGAAGGIDLAELFGFGDTAALEKAQADVEKYTKLVADLQAKQADERAQRFQEERREAEQRLQLAEAEQRYGKDTAAFRNAERAIARQTRAEELLGRVKALDLTAEQATELMRLFNATQAVAVAEEERVDAQRRLTASYQQYAASRVAGEAVTAAGEEMIAQLHEQIRLQEAINTYGQDSVRVLEIQRAQHEAIVSQQVAAMGLTDTAAKEAIRLAMALYDAENASRGLAGGLGTASGAASVLLGRAQAIASAFATAAANARGVGMRTAGLQAQNAALERGSSLAEARAIGAAADTRAALEEQVRQQFGGQVPRTAAARIAASAREAYKQELAFQREQERNAALVKTATPGTGSGTGAGTGGGELDPLGSLLREMAQREKLLGITGRQRAIMEETFKLQEQLADTTLTQDQIIALAEQNVLLEEQEQRYQKIVQIANQVETAFENAFVSFVTGASSAREAASNLLRSLANLWAQAAFRALAGSAGGLFGAFSPAVVASAKGNVFSGGNVIPFANGGVVTGPTMFPMTGGKTGLMGEAGAEAIMPLKRGRDGKLGVSAGAQQQRVAVDVNVYIDEDGNWRSNVRQIARGEVQAAGPSMVRQAVRATYVANSEERLR